MFDELGNVRLAGSQIDGEEGPGEPGGVQGQIVGGCRTTGSGIFVHQEFLESDVGISKLPVAADGRDRPDIVIFDRPAAVVEGDRPFQSVVIVEFKRPGRASYGAEDDPINQVLHCIEKLRAAGVQDRKRQVIRVDESARFFCHVIASLTDKVKRIVSRCGFDPMMGGG